MNHPLAWLSHLFKDAYRSFVRTLLIIGFAMLTVLAIAYLQHTIRRSAAEVDYLFDNTVIFGEIVHGETLDANPRQPTMGVFVTQRTVDLFIDSGFVRSIYLEAGEPRNRLYPHNANIDTSTIVSELFRMINNDMILAINDLEGFITRNTIGTTAHEETDSRFTTDMDLVISFADGFSYEDFSFVASTSIPVPIPVIIHEHILARRGLAIGETAQLVSQSRDIHDVVIIGSYTVGPIMSAAMFNNDPLILMPLDALKSISPRDVAYVIVEFTIYSSFNREIPRVREVLNGYALRAGAGRVAPLLLMIYDDEIRLVLRPMEQTLNLLTMLYPIAFATLALLSLGLAVIMLLQRSKNAAIFRSLGATKLAVRVAYAGGYTLLCIIGAVPGMLITQFLLIDIDAALLVHIAIPFACAIVGAVIGAVIISARPPLELLQVKE
ncbi:MAG: hypothetical protein FWC92_08255 [Defluviitaleaceae bacterium]|nr:hypothetical protein [Defluviitaleaceae bacterium]